MSYVDIVICVGSLPILETWPPIYRGQERTVRDRLRVSQSLPHVYSRYAPCLTDFTFEFIGRPTPPILSPSYWTFVELTLVTMWPSIGLPDHHIQPLHIFLNFFCVLVSLQNGPTTYNVIKFIHHIGRIIGILSVQASICVIEIVLVFKLKILFFFFNKENILISIISSLCNTIL
jgi:hypothetical protein